MKKLTIAFLLGSLAGLVDILPMLAMKLPLNANLSAFSLWVVAGFFIATSEIKINRLLKGVLLSSLILLPNAFLIGWNHPPDLVPVVIMTLILGSLLGYLIDKYAK